MVLTPGTGHNYQIACIIVQLCHPARASSNVDPPRHRENFPEVKPCSPTLGGVHNNASSKVTARPLGAGRGLDNYMPTVRSNTVRWCLIIPSRIRVLPGASSRTGSGLTSTHIRTARILPAIVADRVIIDVWVQSGCDHVRIQRINN